MLKGQGKLIFVHQKLKLYNDNWIMDYLVTTPRLPKEAKAGCHGISSYKESKLKKDCQDISHCQKKNMIGKRLVMLGIDHKQKLF